MLSLGVFEGTLCSFREGIQTQNFNINNINKVMIKNLN